MVERERISGIQLTLLVTAFLMGTSLVVTTGVEAEQDAWLSILMAMFGGILVGSLNVSLAKLFPGKTFIEILQISLGKILGKIIGSFYIFFFIHLTSLIFRNMGDFFATVMIETPMQVFIIIYAVLCAYTVRNGLEVIARTVGFVLIFSVSLYTITALTSLPDWHLNNFLPVLGTGIRPVIRGFISTSGFPFEEIIVFTMIVPYLNKQSELRSQLYKGIILAGSLITIINIENRAIFGQLTSTMIYVSYEKIKYISIGGFLERIEPVFIAIYFFLAFAKGVVTFYAGCLGSAQLFGLKEYKVLVLPLTVICSTLAYTIYNDLIEQVFFAREVYPYYIFPFSILIPGILLIIAKLRK